MRRGGAVVVGMSPVVVMIGRKILEETKNNRLVVTAGVAALLASGAAFFYFFDPATSPIFPPCPFHFLTGLWCPGCGSARALHALIHGRLLAALDLNPLMVVSLPFLGYAAVSWGLRYLTGSGLPRIFTAPFWGWFVVVVVILFWVLRNIPVFPFSVLAP
jgi:hypothetical protein